MVLYVALRVHQPSYPQLSYVQVRQRRFPEARALVSHYHSHPMVSSEIQALDLHRTAFAYAAEAASVRAWDQTAALPCTHTSRLLHVFLAYNSCCYSSCFQTASTPCVRISPVCPHAACSCVPCRTCNWCHLDASYVECVPACSHIHRSVRGD